MEPKAALAKLRELHEQKAALMDELERSLDLTAIWPDCFEAGPVSAQWKGNIRKGKLAFHVTNGDGDTRVFDVIDVPQALWPANTDTDPDLRKRILRHIAKRM